MKSFSPGSESGLLNGARLPPSRSPRHGFARFETKETKRHMGTRDSTFPRCITSEALDRAPTHTPCFFFFLFSLKLSNPESYGPMRQPSTSREYCLLSFLVWPPRQARGHPASLPVRAGDPRACRGQHPGPLGLPQHHPLANLAPHLPSAASGFWYPLRALPFGSPKWGSSLPGIRDPREPGSPRLLDDRGARSIDCLFVL